MGLRILLLDDQTVYRWGLKAHLSRIEECEVVRGTASVAEAIDLAASLQPDVAVVNAAVPDIWHAIAGIKGASPETRLMVLASSATPAFVSQTLRAGVISIMLRNDPPEELVEAVRETAVERGRLSSSLIPFLIEGVHQHSHSPIALLSPREHEVFQLLLDGKSNDEIAATLVISKRTVETHLLHIYRKLGVRDRAGAILAAVREGWLGAPPASPASA